MAALGGMGIGLVWGWVAATVDVFRGRQLVDVVSLSVALAIVSLLVLALGGRPALTAYLGATFVSFLAHSGWKAALRTRFEAPTERR